MDFEAILSTFPGKEAAVLIAKEIAREPKHMPKLWEFATGEHERAWRATWLMDKVYDEEPELIRPYISKMIELIPSLKCESKQRQLLKLISCDSLPKNVSGKFINCCFDYLISSSTAVAVKVHAMQILFNFAKQEPDLKNELALVIEECMIDGTTGFNARARKLLKKLQA
ncbi:hypothetical protein [Ancylomarina sp. 16SWW S1-10-2]|uniref:hypothetical protein n=1 Tax=Ancylomarina sp. 16SWW S1-10-2 TaxID=2499681 RepID=UPI0012AD6229|nr:hypothetical protein [Ancylomarina sp. 16SWW S1-10-2]MRT92862.1 hypothetical protein [Ancylomarina sp. 16SWW S1-10-2]